MASQKWRFFTELAAFVSNWKLVRRPTIIIGLWPVASCSFFVMWCDAKKPLSIAAPMCSSVSVKSSAKMMSPFV